MKAETARQLVRDLGVEDNVAKAAADAPQPNGPQLDALRGLLFLNARATVTEPTAAANGTEP
jgi:hypothetical protein